MTGARPRIAAVVLAAGSSRRMGDTNKMVATLGGRPLVRIAAEAALASDAHSVMVVTGYEAGEVTRALDGLDVRLIHNARYAEGMSGSLRLGIGGLHADVDGALVLLGDMPAISPAIINRLIALYRPDKIVVPFHEGKRGNPVLWPRALFSGLMAVTGDKGGRAIIDAHPERVIAVDCGPEVLADLDTPEALSEARKAVE
jgi:molybdenum cofactor cytidylyltransferase